MIFDKRHHGAQAPRLARTFVRRGGGGLFLIAHELLEHAVEHAVHTVMAGHMRCALAAAHQTAHILQHGSLRFPAGIMQLALHHAQGKFGFVHVACLHRFLQKLQFERGSAAPAALRTAHGAVCRVHILHAFNHAAHTRQGPAVFRQGGEQRGESRFLHVRCEQEQVFVSEDIEGIDVNFIV